MSESEWTTRVAQPCGHYKCHPDKCRAYTAEQVTPDEADFEVARQLIAEGWHSTSSRRCSIARWKEPPPVFDVAISESVPYPFRGMMIDMLERSRVFSWPLGSALIHIGERDMVNVESYIERRTITLKQFRAFKKLGGPHS